jgi:two-component system OmpR family sensor kinase
MNSIRRKLLVALLGTLFIVMLLGGWATYRASRDEAGQLFDYQMKQIALTLRDQNFQNSLEAFASDESLDYVIRVWDLNGLSVYYSRPHEALPEPTQLGYSIADTSEDEWRVFAIQYHGLTISVAQPMRVRRQLAADAALSTLKPFVALLPVLGVLIWFVVGRGLKPLDRLARSVQERRADLLTPLSDVAVPDEVQPLVASLNDLLSRLKAALDAQRDFVADAAHELRTPLTALQLQAQLVERAGDEGERGAALAELKRGLQRATHAVEQMLTLARQEPGAVEYRPTEVSLADLIRRVVAAHAQLAAARGIDLGVEANDASDEETVVIGDAEALRILVSNLVGNALRYTPAGGRVDVACGSGVTGAFIEVADSGPGIPAAERERVFDRFYRRAEGSEDAAESGSGLGLAIVRAIATRHGATVSLGDAEGGGLLVRVTFGTADKNSSA